jgi:large subunit ribosomal protein L17
MRHYKKGRKLGTDAAHTKAMKKSLVAALFTNDRIKTVEARAKEIRPDVDRIITWAKKGDLHSRRLAIAKLGDKELVREIFEKVAQGQFADRQGGYTRIMKLGNRVKGDNAPIVIMELVTEPVQKKAKKEAAPAKEEAPKAEEKAEETVEEAAEGAAEEAAEAADDAKVEEAAEAEKKAE